MPTPNRVDDRWLEQQEDTEALLYLHRLRDERIPRVLEWLNATAITLSHFLWTNGRLTDLVNEADSGHTGGVPQTWLIAHVGTSVSELVAVINDAFVNEVVHPGGRLSLSPGATDRVQLAAAIAQLGQSAEVLRQAGLDVQDLMRAKARLAVESGAIFHRPRQKVSQRSVGPSDLVEFGGRIYQAFVTGRSLPRGGPAEDVDPRFRVLRRCSICSADSPIFHGLMVVKHVAPLLADLMTRLAVAPQRQGARAGDAWTTRAAQDLIDEFKRQVLTPKNRA